LFSFRELYRAYGECRKNKRGKPAALRFEVNAEENLLDLKEELVSRTYHPSPFSCFVTERPKYREIFAAAFRDRIVHHLVVARLQPVWERYFIHDTYACRKGRGTLATVHRLQAMMRAATGNGRRRAWFLHLDIRSFFTRIDKQVLMELLDRRLEKENPPWKETMAWLLGEIIFHDPTREVIKKGRLPLFDRVPEHKSLFFTGNITGLPIGNYTSQFFANVYLDPLDQFVKHELKCRHYVRYVDDLVLVHTDPNLLTAWALAIGLFLRSVLKLELHPERRLAPVTNGCDFLGYIVRPARLLVRRRVAQRCKEKLLASKRELIRPVRQGAWEDHRPEQAGKLRSVLASYEGHFRHAASWRLRRKLFGEALVPASKREAPETGCLPAQEARWLAGYFILKVNRRKAGAVSGGDRPRGPSRTLDWRVVALDFPPRFHRLADQVRWFLRRFPGMAVLVRIGRYVECYGSGAAKVRETLGLAKGSPRPGLGSRSGFPARLGRVFMRRLASEGIPFAFVDQTGRVRGTRMDRTLRGLFRI